MRRLWQLPLVLQIALGVKLAGWMVFGLILLPLEFGSLVHQWLASSWLMYLVLLLAVALLEVGIFWPKTIQYQPRFFIGLDIVAGVILGLFGIVGILFAIVAIHPWILHLMIIIESRVFQG